MNIVRGIAGDGAQIALSQSDAGPLIVPEALGVQAIEAQGQSEE